MSSHCINTAQNSRKEVDITNAYELCINAVVSSEFGGQGHIFQHFR
jgi:hypothetical protein